MKRFSITITILMAIVLIPFTLNANTIHIPGDYSTIQAGIDAAQNGDTVLVADGTYTGTGNKNIDFTGKAIVVMSENGAENCIIDCENDGRGFYFHSGEDSSSVLDGFTITNGNISDSGGGINCEDYSSPVISNCIISGNTALHGGGIFCHFSNPTINNCTLSGNSVGEYDWGGGIYCFYSNSTISSSIISGNSANRGGGIYCAYGSPTITDCDISNNSASNSGGIYCAYNSPTIENCTIIVNLASDYAGGVFCLYSNATIKNCTVKGNSVSNSGGGINCRGSSIPIVENCTIIENTAGDGGGIFCYESASPIGVNNIIWSNTASIGNQIHLESGASFTCTYSDIQGGWSGTGNIDADPLFTPGPDGDYYLSQPFGGQPVTSPCVNAGDAPVPPNSGTTCTNQGYDLGIIDLGYHYPHVEDFPLPVEMTLFSATGGDSKVTLHWVTASELDNDHFNLYKSEMPEGGFRLIAQIEGSGTSVSEHEYFYSDHQVINGFTYYYRISDVDINGTEAFFPETISAIPGGKGAGAVADNFGLNHSYPNPFNSSANISFNILTAGTVRLSVYNEQGAEVTVIMDSYCEPGGYIRQFLADNLASGVYFVSLKQGELTSVSRLVLLR